jgi:hypothetical protein
VYRAFTDRLDAWFAAPGSLRMEVAVNEPFFFETQREDGREPHYGRFLRLVPYSIVELTWVTGPSGTSGAETVVTVELTPIGDGTHLRLIHAGFADAGARDRHVAAWPFALKGLELAFPAYALRHLRPKEELWGGLIMKTKNEPNTKKEEYIDRMAEQLKEWSAKIDELEARASGTAAGVRAGYEERIRTLKEKRDLLSAGLREMKESGSSAWTVLKTGVEAAKNDLKEALAAARDKFRKAA